MKKQLLNFSILILIVLFGFNSCTIKKRSYQPGYYTDWNNVTKKSKTNSENLSKQQQEKFVVENNVDEFEDFDQRELIQEYEPVYASSDENLNKIEIINSTKQNNTFSTNTKKIASEINESAIKEKTIKSSGRIKGDRKVHWAAIVGFVLSILAIAAIFTIGFGSLIVAIAGLVFCGIAHDKISTFPEKYSGKGFAVAGLIIVSIILLLGMLSLFAGLIFFITLFF